MAGDGERRMRTRIPKRIALGLAIGAGLGAVMGALAGAIPSAPASIGILVIVFACAIFGGMVGALIGGYASLESPDPGREPSDTERPITDRPGLTREEHPGPTTPSVTDAVDEPDARGASSSAATHLERR